MLLRYSHFGIPFPKYGYQMRFPKLYGRCFSFISLLNLNLLRFSCCFSGGCIYE